MYRLYFIILLISYLLISSCTTLKRNNTKGYYMSDTCYYPSMEEDTFLIRGHFHSFDQAAQIIYTGTPLYPYIYKDRQIRGQVLMSVLIKANGEVGCASIIQSNVPEFFECIAFNRIMKYRFDPARRNGVPVACRLAIPVRFRVPK